MFEITLLAMGKLKEKFYISATEEYTKRLGAYCKFNLLKNEDFGMLQYKFFDKNGAEINLNPDKEDLPEEDLNEECQDNGKKGK